MFLSGNLFNDFPYQVIRCFTKYFYGYKTNYVICLQKDIMGFSHLSVTFKDRGILFESHPTAELVAVRTYVLTCEMVVVTYLSGKYNMGLKLYSDHKAFVKKQIKWTQGPSSTTCRN